MPITEPIGGVYQKLTDEESGQRSETKNTDASVSASLSIGERGCCQEVEKVEPPCHDPCAPKEVCSSAIYFGLDGHASKCSYGAGIGANCLIGSALFILLGVLTIGFVTMMASTLTSMASDPVVGWFIYSIIYGAIILAVVSASTRISVSLFQSIDTVMFIIFGRISFCNGFLTLVAQLIGWALCPLLYLCFFDMGINNFTVPGPGIIQTMSPIVVTPIVPVGCNAVFLAQYFLLTINGLFSYFIATGCKCPPIAIGALYASTAFIFVAFSGAPGDLWRWFFVAAYQGSFECWASYLFSLLAAFLTVLILVFLICKIKKVWAKICHRQKKC